MKKKKKMAKNPNKSWSIKGLASFKVELNVGTIMDVREGFIIY